MSRLCRYTGTLRATMPWGDWRDDYVTGNWRAEIGCRVDPDWPVDREEFDVRGGPWPSDHWRCLCPCHQSDEYAQQHCAVCAMYWTPPMSYAEIDRIGDALRQRARRERRGR